MAVLDRGTGVETANVLARRYIMLLRHSFLYVMVRIAAGILGMVTTAALTRILDPETYGKYGVALVIMSIGAAITFEWLGVSFVRFYQPKTSSPRALSTFAYIYLTLVLLSGVIVGLLLGFDVFGPEVRPVLIAGTVLLWGYSCFELLARVEIVQFKPKRYMWMNLIRGALNFIGAALAAWLTHDALWTAVGTSAGMTAGALIGTSVNYRTVLQSFDKTLAREVFRFGLPLAVSAMMTGITVAGTRGLVGALDSTEALGIYTAAFFLVQNTLTVVAAGLSQASYALAVRAVEEGDLVATRRQLLANGTMLISVMAPACLGMALTAKGISSVLVGERFAAGVAQITPWMAAATFFSSLRYHFLDHAFQLGRRPNLLAGIAAVAAVLAVVLNLILIPRQGPVGAAIAVTFTMIVSCVHAAIVGRKAFPMPLPWNSAVRVLFCCLLLAVVVLLIRGSGLAHTALQIGVGACTYAAAAVALNVMDSREPMLRLFSKKLRIAHQR